MTGPHLDPAPDSRNSADTPEDNEPDTIATPEGDNEFAPDQPIKPVNGGLQKVPSIDTNKV